MSLRVKMLLYSSLIVLLTASSFFCGAYLMSSRELADEIGLRLQGVAGTAALQIDGDMFERIIDGNDVGSDEFSTLRDQLRDIRAVNGLSEELYTLRSAGPGKLEFVVMTHENPFYGSIYEYATLGITDTVEHVLGEGLSANTGLFTSTSNDYISGYGPIKNSAGETVGLVSVDYTVESFNHILLRKLSFLALIGLVALVVAMVLALLALRFVTGPIQSTISAIKSSIDDKDLTRELKVSTKDEIGELALCFNNFMGEVRNLVLTARQSSEHLVAASRDMSEKSDAMHSQAGEMQGEARETVGLMSETTQSITRISEASAQSARDVEKVVKANAQIGDRLNQVDQAAELMSQDMNEMVEAVRQLSTTIREIEGNVDEASRITSSANAAADKTNKTVISLEGSVEAIGEVVRTISQIADKTNLLALNASIEAARAGEAGKGFNVVAGEVKDLAGQTAQATDEIQKRIEQIQAETIEAIEALKDITLVIATIDEKTGAIATALNQQTATVSQIESNAGETAVRAEEVSGSVNESAAFSASLTEDAEHAMNGSRAIADDASGIRGSANQVCKSAETVKEKAEHSEQSAHGLLEEAQELAGVAEELQQRIAEYKV